jgi:hypothetical protein
MNERALRRLLREIALGSIPWSLAAVGVACGGTTATDDSLDAGSHPPRSDGAIGVDAGSRDAGGPQTGSPEAGGPETGSPEAGILDAPAQWNPCLPPACGGGFNYCVVPDAGTEALGDGGIVTGNACDPFCNNGGCQLVEVDAQQLVRCWSPCTGRRPAGLVVRKRRVRPGVAAYLEEIAYLEAVSIAAFANLRNELRHHGAPRRLVRAAERASRDERRHARTMSALARRHGARCRKPRVVARPIRTLAEMALDNAVEGCVRETFGALVACYQALAAGDSGMRAAMKIIAQDETRHAALAWSIEAWIEPRLNASERGRVASAGRDAVAEIAASTDPMPAPSLRRFAGLPGPTEVTQMVARMRAELWRG